MGGRARQGVRGRASEGEVYESACEHGHERAGARARAGAQLGGHHAHALSASLTSPAPFMPRFDRKDIEMNKLVAASLESRFKVFDCRTQHPVEGFAGVAEKAHKATVWLARHLPQNRDVWMTSGGNGGINLYRYNYPPTGRVERDADVGAHGAHRERVCARARSSVGVGLVCRRIARSPLLCRRRGSRQPPEVMHELLRAHAHRAPPPALLYHHHRRRAARAASRARSSSSTRAS